MKFSIIIPAYNEEKYLSATLEKIYRAVNSFPNQFEVIVVNNDSKDKTAEIAESFSARVVNETVHNIARVRNTGARLASGDVFIFIDADSHVPDGHKARPNFAESLFSKICEAMTKTFLWAKILSFTGGFQNLRGKTAVICILLKTRK